MAISSLHYFTETLEVTLLSVLAIDRAVAILAPERYRTSTARGALKACALAYLVVLPVKGLPLLLLSGDPKKMISCLYINSAPGSAYNIYSQTLDLALCCLILLLYSVLATRLRLRMRQLRLPASDQALASETISLDQQSRSGVVEADLRRISKLMPTFRNLVLVHSFFTFMGKFLLFLSGQVQGEAQRFALYSGVFIMFDQFVNVIVLIATNRDIRHSCVSCLWK